MGMDHKREGREGHLCGAERIAEIFGISRNTVAEWKEMGAPIFFVGKKYQANYAELWGWVKLNFVEA